MANQTLERIRGPRKDGSVDYSPETQALYWRAQRKYWVAALPIVAAILVALFGPQQAQAAWEWFIIVPLMTLGFLFLRLACWSGVPAGGLPEAPTAGLKSEADAYDPGDVAPL